MACLEITVVRIDKAERILDGIFDANGPSLIGSAGHPDLDSPVLSFPALFILEGLAALIQDGAYLKVQVEVESLGSSITNWNVPIHPVPGARESESYGLADVNPAATHHGYLNVELFDLECLDLARRR